tara:strand:- start:682 stop:1392 length:711 start_codon:yes stop_codon:yes gene_type:complete
MSKKVIFTNADNIFVVSKSKTTNKKISDGKPLVQTYTFSRDQYNLATTSKGFGMKRFFALDGSNCMDCKFSGNQGSGGCYTHKFNQYVGFLSMLRSIKLDQLTPVTSDKVSEIIELSRDTYVRFGTYGEPSLMPLSIIKSMTESASSWTGYTHQHDKEFAQGYKDYFMASTHTEEESDNRSADGWRSFIALDNGSDADAISCPASAEAGFVSNCAKCSLCSGAKGKGKKNVKILLH